ncbi:hypothetical protein ACP4OV_006661 [Aristida adscensionis]
MEETNGGDLEGAGCRHRQASPADTRARPGRRPLVAPVKADERAMWWRRGRGQGAWWRQRANRGVYRRQQARSGNMQWRAVWEARRQCRAAAEVEERVAVVGRPVKTTSNAREVRRWGPCLRGP